MITTTQKGKFNIICLFSHDWKQIKEEDGYHFWKCMRCGKKEIIGSVDELPNLNEMFAKLDF
jgi:hypothetical protein